MILRYLILNKFYLNNRFKNSIYYCKGIEPYRFIFLFNIFFKYPSVIQINIYIYFFII